MDKKAKHINELFLQLMKIALGNADRFAEPPTQEEWVELMLMSAKQSVVGVAFCGVERLPAEQRPPLEVIMDWAAVVDKIEKDNVALNETCVKVCSIFKQEGINACILKGQGMGALYDAPLRRCSGDIDVWMEGGKEKVVSYIRKNFPKAEKPGGHHIAVTLKGGVEMEVHYIPAELFSPFHEKRMLQYYNNVQQQQWSNMLPSISINVPTKEFDLFFIIAHLFLHWAIDGCGLKQILDYYYLLKSVKGDDAVKQKAFSVLKECGLENFTSAMMAIFVRDFGMPEDLTICNPDYKKGKVLLEDIIAVGTVSCEELKQQSNVVKFIRRWFRVWRILPLAPTELPWVLPKSTFGWITSKISR
ncbi:MAG: nucleotidyltransferase family protein [Prevotellaceae bacterium]|nr:nucleotidyltransferase family protein [Candidatus Minthosoma caballi]